MGEPWGISGPAFIGIYIAAILLPLIVSVLWARRQAHAADSLHGIRYTQLPSALHLAYLVGGGARAAEAAVAGLVEGEQLRVDSRGILSVTGAAPRVPLEHQAVAAVAASQGTARAGEVRQQVKKSLAVADIRADLERTGLIVPRALARSRQLKIIMLYLVVLAIGISRLVSGIALGRPVGWLVFLLIVAAVAFLFAWLMYGTSGEPPQRTPTGDKVLAEATAEYDAVRAGTSPVGRSVFAGAAALVAIGGLAVYPDQALATALLVSPSGSSGSSDGGSDSGCSSGSSCGGGCGGGCGG